MADYGIARAVWNGAIDRHPRLIARCIGTTDVVAAVRFARDHDLEIAIRGGAHNVAGTAVCDAAEGQLLRASEAHRDAHLKDNAQGLDVTRQASMQTNS